MEPGSDYIIRCTEEGYNDQEGSSFFSFANCKKENGNFIIPIKYDINLFRPRERISNHGRACTQN
jgi:hypothetical protein